MWTVLDHAQRVGNQQHARLIGGLIWEHNRYRLTVFQFDDRIVGVGQAKRISPGRDVQGNLFVSSFDCGIRFDLLEELSSFGFRPDRKQNGSVSRRRSKQGLGEPAFSRPFRFGQIADRRWPIGFIGQQVGIHQQHTCSRCESVPSPSWRNKLSRELIGQRAAVDLQQTEFFQAKRMENLVVPKNIPFGPFCRVDDFVGQADCLVGFDVVFREDANARFPFELLEDRFGKLLVQCGVHDHFAGGLANAADRRQTNCDHRPKKYTIHWLAFASCVESNEPRQLYHGSNGRRALYKYKPGVNRLKSIISIIAKSRWALGSLALVFAIQIGNHASAQYDLEKMRLINPQMQPPMTIDAERVESQAIRVVRGKYLELYTDLRDRGDLDSLVEAFDQAVPQWCNMFEINIRKTAPWRLSGFLMEDRSRFEKAGLCPADLPEFPAGFNQGHHFWMYAQSGDYYTRHLMLHEGTHSFMQWFLGGSGPAWYSEGMAERIALHRWRDNQLELDIRIRDRSECDYWGRPKLIQLALQADRRLRLDEVFDFPNDAFRNVESYAWAWAACEFFTRHPASQSAFAWLPKEADNMTARFSQKFKLRLKDEWPRLELDWQQFINDLDYGIQSDRTAIRSVVPVKAAESFQIELRTDHGWQDTGIAVAVGETWRLSSAGRFQVAAGPPAWPCEAGGITLDYYRRRPLGMVVAGILPSDAKDTAVIASMEVGLGRAIAIEKAGTLLLRINESPAKLDDNKGALQITIQRE